MYPNEITSAIVNTKANMDRNRNRDQNASQKVNGVMMLEENFG